LNRVVSYNEEKKGGGERGLYSNHYNKYLVEVSPCRESVLARLEEIIGGSRGVVCEVVKVGRATC